MKIEWEEFVPEEPTLGPPRPMNCEAGWESHVWELQLDGANRTIDLSTKCDLCNRGWQEYGIDYLSACFDVKMEFRTETYGGPDGYEVDAYFDISPLTEDEILQ